MRYLFTVVLILYVIAGVAQEKGTSFGLRGGGVSGLSIQFIDDDLSGMELILGYQMNGFRFVGMVQKYRPLAVHRIANLFFVSGVGAHAGYIKYDNYNTKVVNGVEYYSYQRMVSPIIGADLMMGFEYQFESIPFNISLDYKPYFELFGQKTFRVDFWDIAFSLRYIFNRQN